MSTTEFVLTPDDTTDTRLRPGARASIAGAAGETAAGETTAGAGVADESARAAVRELVAAATSRAERGEVEPKAPELPLRARHGFD